jgi:hypothetical protein
LEKSWLLLGLGAPDSVRCARRVQGKLAALRTRRRRTAIIHRTVRWCTGLSGGAPDCPVSRPRRSRRSRENDQRRTTKIHRTVRWCNRLSGEPTVACATVGRAIRGRCVAAPTVGMGHRTVRCAPDCPVCTGQCSVRQLPRICNGRMRQNRKEIRTGHAIVTVRWRTGLSGAPTRQKATLAFLVDLQRLLAALGL